jgi:photosystem II stability/assembly factor-like uncharacterized protein
MRNLRVLILLVFSVAGLATAAEVGGESCWIRAVASAEHRVWVACEESRLMVSQDYGATWDSKSLPPISRIRALSFQDSRRGWIAGDGGTLLATQDGGFNWRKVTVPTTEHLTAIQWQEESGWITAYGGVIVHSGDGGRTWTLQPTGVKQPLEGIYFADENHGWAVGWVGTIIRTGNGGHHWEPAATPAGTMWSLNAVHFRDATNGWAVGFAGQILRSHDGGATWKEQESPLAAWFSSITFDRWGKGWIAADTHLLTTEDGGETWKAVPTDDRMYLSWLVPADGSLWAIGQYGVLKQSPDGVAWRQVRTPGHIDAPPSRYERRSS